MTNCFNMRSVDTMKSGNLLFSAVQFIFSCAVFFLGVFFIALGSSSPLRSVIAKFFFETTASFFLIGYFILGFGILLLMGFYALHRGIYYSVLMGTNRLLIDPALVRDYVANYWGQVFPQQDLGVEVVVTKDQKFQMFVEMPLISSSQQEAILEKAEKDLGLILKKQIGYQREFSFLVIFK